MKCTKDMFFWDLSPVKMTKDDPSRLMNLTCKYYEI